MSIFDFRYALFLVVIIMISCQSEYEKLVDRELDTNEVHTDLLLGLNIGQTKKEFYAACWDLNKNQVISQGPTNENVLYIIPKEEMRNDTNQVEMLFFGIFNEEDVMIGVRQRFFYTAWSLWNDDMQSDKLIESIKNYYLDKYSGNDFINLDLGLEKVKSYVKVDGNRQITVYQRDPKEVGAKIEDLRYKLKR